MLRFLKTLIRPLVDICEKWFINWCPVLPISKLNNIKLFLVGNLPKEHKSKILDLGGGNGYWSNLLRLNSEEIYCYVTMDVLPQNSYESEISFLLGTQGDAHKLPFLTGSFDAILSFEMLEHVHDPQEVLNQMNQALSPGGVVVLSTRQHWRTHGSPHDYYRYTRQGLNHLFTQAGFEILDSLPLGGPMSIVATVIDQNTFISRPIIKQFILYPVWAMALLADILFFRENIRGSCPDTSGWLIFAKKPVTHF